jgi:hypothetical protein
MNKQRWFFSPIIFVLVFMLAGAAVPASPVVAAPRAASPVQQRVEADPGGHLFLPMLANSNDSTGSGDTVSFNVKWADNVTIVDQSQMALLKEIDLENHRYTFDAQGVADAKLDLSVGRILVIYNTSLRRISAVQNVGATLVVDTEYVDLTDAIVDGDLDWNVGVLFDPARIPEVSVAGQSVRPNADGVIDFTYTNGPFKYALKMTLQKENAAIDFSVTKGIGSNASAKLTAQGTVQSFRSRDSIVIRNHELQTYDHSLDKMTGDLTLGLVMAASGRDVVNLELPVVLIKYPVVIGVIPVILNIKVQFVVNASIPAEGSAQVKAEFTYDSDVGFHYAGSSVESAGRLGAVTFGKQIAQTGAPGAIGANFGMGFPRVELGIFGETVVPWAQTAFLVGGSFTVIPACQTADATFLGAAGVDLSFLGVKADLGSKTFFNETKPLLRAGNCPPD